MELVSIKALSSNELLVAYTRNGVKLQARGTGSTYRDVPSGYRVPHHTLTEIWRWAAIREWAQGKP